jgi:TPR repeat protein
MCLDPTSASDTDCEAMFHFAECLAIGDGVERDETAALPWHEDAACGGHLEAMFKLGLYPKTIGNKDMNESCASAWFKKSLSRRTWTRLGADNAAGPGPSGPPPRALRAPRRPPTDRLARREGL